MKYPNLDLQILFDRTTLQSLENDLGFYGFKFFNDMANTIIVNYYQSYFDTSKILLERIKPLLTEHLNNPQMLLSLEQQLLSIIIERDDTKELKTIKKKIHISHKYESEFDTLQLMMDSLFGNTLALSTLLRMMLVTFSKLTRTEKEKILFKDTLESIEKLIKKQVLIKVKTKQNELIELLPYDIFDPFDHDVLFLVGELKSNQLRTFRISSIKNVISTYEKMDKSTKNVEYYENVKKMKFDLSNLTSFIDLDSKNILPKIVQLKQLTQSIPL